MQILSETSSQKNRQGEGKRMQRRSFYESTNRYEWNTTSQEYLDHIRRMERSPTIVIDAPQYPSAHVPVQNSVANKEARDDHRSYNNSHTNNQRQHAPEVVRKKVQFAKDEKTIDKGKTEYDEEKSIDSEADDFIKRRHKNFEISKWATFKAY